MKICLVTTEFPGASPSGGIGTYVKNLGNLLKSEHEVTILVVSEHANLREFNGDEIRFVSINEITSRVFSGGTLLNYKTSLSIFDWVKYQQFDHVNFPDWLGLGFAAIQAKETGIALNQTVLSVTLHGISAWTSEPTPFPRLLEVEANKIHFMETYSIERADQVLSPSEYMKKWINDFGLLTKKQIEVIINPITPEDLSARKLDTSEITKIVFLGRIEPRKGIGLFLEALELLENTKTVEVAIIGRSLFGYSPINFENLRSRFLNVNHFGDLSTAEALEMCKGENTLVVIPSLIENCPYVIQETTSLNLRVLSTNVGGIPELIGSGNLVEPDAGKIRERIQNFLNDKNSVPRSQSIVDIVSNRVKWSSFFRKVIQTSPQPKSPMSKIGVVVAHYNQSNFLSSALNSIASQTYQNYEVVVIDDGSNEFHSKEFLSIAKDWMNPKFRFIEQENHDVGYTRNRGVRELDVEIVCFLDADDLLEPNALDYFVKSISSGADISTTHFSIFLDDSNPLDGDKYLYGCYEPMGPIVNLLWHENVLGGANFAATKKVFQELGGFTEIRKSNHQDWQFLTKAFLNNKDLRVIPERLLFYRVLGDSMARSRSHIQGTFEVVDRFTENASPEILRGFANELMKSYLIKDEKEEKVQLVASTLRLAQRLRHIALVIAPYGSWRWKTLIPLFRRIVK